MKALFCLLVVSVPVCAYADDAALAQCRHLADGGARLSCYDAIPLAAAAPVSALVSLPATVPAASIALTPQQKLASFGMETTPKSDRLEQVETSINGHFDGWLPNQLITLANGQVWRVVDGSEGVGDIDNPRVTVRRGVLGAFYLDIDGITRAPKVRRVQ